MAVVDGYACGRWDGTLAFAFIGGIFWLLSAFLVRIKYAEDCTLGLSMLTRLSKGVYYIVSRRKERQDRQVADREGAYAAKERLVM